MAYKEPNPYKKVWDSVEDHEAYLAALAANNTLFVPTAGEMARRHMDTARYLLAQARKFGQSNPEHGREVFEEALFNVQMAKSFKKLDNTILERSR